jgi:hypothetical protein
MKPSDGPQAIFSLDEARQLLPRVKHVTADAVRRTESLAAQLHGLGEEDPDHETLSAALRDVVDGWAAEVQLLGPRARGVWLVDFDNGQGYYCWAYPEAGITHYHAYGDAFDVRLGIH